MSIPIRAALVLSVSVALSGCQATLHGNQSTAGGSTTTVTSGQVSGSAKFAGGRVSFSSGQPVPANAAGGQVRLSGGAAAVLVVGLAVADFVNYIRAESQPKPLRPADGDSIAATCSCYRKAPETGDGIPVTR